MDKLYEKLHEIFLPHSKIVAEMIIEELLCDIINLTISYQNMHENATKQEIEDFIIGEMKKRVDVNAAKH